MVSGRRNSHGVERKQQVESPAIEFRQKSRVPAGGELTPNVLTIHEYEITLTSLEQQPRICYACDLHKRLGEELPREWYYWCKEHEKNPLDFFITLGDLIDAHRPTERDILANPKLGEAEVKRLNDFYLEICRETAEDLSFMRGRKLGAIEGHHFGWVDVGEERRITTTRHLCELLDCEYLGGAAILRVNVRYKEYKDFFDMYVWHGAGAAQLLGTSMGQVEKLSRRVLAQVYVEAHDHKTSSGWSSPIQLWRAPDGKLDVLAQDTVYIRAGGMLKGLEPWKPSYVVRKRWMPSSLRFATLKITPRLDSKAKKEFSLHLNAET